MKGQKKNQLIASFLLIFAIFVFTEIKAESFPERNERIIEVCSEGVVYVPYGTKLVKCNGKVKKVLGMTPYQPTMERGGEEGSCLCWDCCGDACGIIISCDAEPEKFSDSDSNKNGTLCLIWFDCD